MARLIDANALDEILVEEYLTHNEVTNARTLAYMQVYNAAIDTARIKIREVDTIDAVPVVRCKDCKNRGTPYSCPMRKLVMPWQGAGSYEDCTEDEGYCHMGVKMDGGTD